MNIVVNSPSLALSEHVQEYVSKKFSKLEKISPGLPQLHLSLFSEKKNHRAELTCHYEHVDFHAKALSKDLYLAIGRALGKLIVLLKKAKVRHAPQLSQGNLRALSKEHLHQYEEDESI